MTPTDSVSSSISNRKLEHLSLALAEGSQGDVSAGWDDVRLIHNCVPEIAFSDVILQTSFLGQMLDAPLWISGMTGGHDRAATINARLARAAERHGIAMGLGSQRASLADDGLRASYASARKAAPDAVLVANIGVPQLVDQHGHRGLHIDDLERIVSDVGAQALAIHLNWVQECVQAEGDRNAAGGLEAIHQVAERLSVPVMVKETGAGIAREQARTLTATGIAALDVGGAGGTSMVRIESNRESNGDARMRTLHDSLDRWGIPTAAAVLETQGCGIPIIATGGVRTGLDAGRGLALGAQMVGVGRPFLVAADESEGALDAAITNFLHELRTVLFLCGCAQPEEMRVRRPILTGSLLTWATQRGLW